MHIDDFMDKKQNIYDFMIDKVKMVKESRHDFWDQTTRKCTESFLNQWI